MISPHTPPGTGLVAVQLSREQTLACVVPQFRKLAALALFLQTEQPLVGRRYTLVSVQVEQYATQGFSCSVAEMPGRWPLETFDVATLPECLTELLSSRPVLRGVPA